VAGIQGDFAQLQHLQVQLARLGTAAARTDVCRVVAEAAEKQVDDGFRLSRDPYGKSWAPLTSRTGKPLLDTGTHLRSTLAPKVTPDGFVITTAFPGAPVHQYGATIRAKGKALRFRAGGARPRGHGRGQTGGVVFAKQVTIPKRQFMPEGQVGPIWGPPLEAAADLAVRNSMGRP
jgi:phage gpG-like protein